MFSESPITLVFAIATVFVSWQAFSNTRLFEKWLFSPFIVKRDKEYYRILSHALIHANWMHLIFNMIAFYSFGRNMEMVFRSEAAFRSVFPASIKYWGESAGTVYFIILYVVGVAFATIPAFMKHRDHEHYRAVGASGGVSAVMMASAIMFPTQGILFFMVIPMPAFIWAIIFLFLEDYLSKKGGTNIAHDAHIWGAMFGIAFVGVINPELYGLFFQKVAAYIHDIRT